MLEAKNILKIVVLVLSVMVSQSINAQGVKFHSDQAMEGYTLYESRESSSAVLIDNCGHIINEWDEVAAEHHPKLLPNGNIVYIESFSLDIIEKDWNGNIVNDLSINSLNISLDYEVIVMPNGNYLCVARKSFSKSQFEDLGYNYNNAQGTGIGNPVQVDMVVEVDRNSGDIVWRWNIADHVIQERDPSRGNYGVVADHPELLNMDAIATYDWRFIESFMINGFDYNPELDQIVLSIRKMSEIAIIDHSTTTEEAEGHTGGNYGKGGDILYRWGNPQNYGQGNAGNRKLFFQHNPNWIKYGEHAGKLIIYNNGLNGPNYSTAPIINPPKNTNGSYILEADSAFGPANPDLEYGFGLGLSFYSEYTSAAKIIANGNVLITVGGTDDVYEMTPNGALVWNYELFESDLTFRVEKYALDYPAFSGRDLTPGDVLEFPPSTVSCTLVDVEDAYFDNSKVWVSGNKVMIDTDITTELDVNIYSIDGKLCYQTKGAHENSIDISSLLDGLYLVNIREPKSGYSISYKVIK